MREAAYDFPTEQDTQFGRPDPQDANLRIHFYLRPVKNEAKSKEKGRAIFEDQEYIKIRAPGDKESESDAPVNEFSRRRFATIYAAWKAGGSGEKQTGTPLTVWAGISGAQVEELRYLGARTVEDLAGISDASLQNFMGGPQLRQRARDFIAAAAGDAPMVQMRAELEELRNQAKANAAAMAEQAKLLEQLTEPAPAAVAVAAKK